MRFWNRRTLAGILMIAVGLGFALSRDASSAMASKLEVRQIEAGYVVGRPGLKVRLTLQSGEAVEYRTEDPVEAEMLLRMTDSFVSGRARMHAEMEGSVVRGIQISGPGVRIAQ